MYSSFIGSSFLLCPLQSCVWSECIIHILPRSKWKQPPVNIGLRILKNLRKNIDGYFIGSVAPQPQPFMICNCVVNRRFISVNLLCVAGISWSQEPCACQCILRWHTIPVRKLIVWNAVFLAFMIICTWVAGPACLNNTVYFPPNAVSRVRFAVINWW